MAPRKKSTAGARKSTARKSSARKTTAGKSTASKSIAKKAKSSVPAVKRTAKAAAKGTKEAVKKAPQTAHTVADTMAATAKVLETGAAIVEGVAQHMETLPNVQKKPRGVSRPRART